MQFLHYYPKRDIQDNTRDVICSSHVKFVSSITPTLDCVSSFPNIILVNLLDSDWLKTMPIKDYSHRCAD
jgi:hypothetical protein